MAKGGFILNQLWNIGFSQILSYSTIVLLVGNICYIIYTFAKKKVYYDNLFITFAIYFSALIVEPISASIKFNTKYGYEVIDLLYFGIIAYIIVISILRNNNFFMYNISWEKYYRIIKEIFRKKEIDTYYRKPTIYIGNGEGNISHSLNLFSKKVIIVKFKGVESLMDLDELKSKFVEQKLEVGIARYYYLVINIIITFILLLNVRY